MQVEEIRAVLDRALRLRMPRFGAEQGVRDRIDALDTYLGETAIARGELEEARFYAYEAGRALKEEWDAIAGWETVIDKSSRNRTQADVEEAKRTINPGLWEGIQEAKYLVERLTDQIKRLTLDDAAASRRYTMLTGS